jgi:rod shape-determining protein MreD
MIKLDRKSFFEGVLGFFFLRFSVFLFLSCIVFIAHSSPYCVFKNDLVFLFIFQFSLYIPFLFPIATAFGVGILCDLLTFGTLGVNAFYFVIIRLFLEGQKDYLFFKDFHYVWGIFTAFLGLKVLIYYFFGYQSVLESSLWACALYPLTAKLIQKIFKF